MFYEPEVLTVIRFGDFYVEYYLTFVCNKEELFYEKKFYPDCGCFLCRVIGAPFDVFLLYYITELMRFILKEGWLVSDAPVELPDFFRSFTFNPWLSAWRGFLTRFGWIIISLRLLSVESVV